MNKTDRKVAGIFGTLWQLVPCTYMAISRTVPGWAQWTFLVWLSLYILFQLWKAIE